MSRHGRAARLIITVVLASAIVILALHRDFFQADRLQHELRQLGDWAPILFILCYALAGGALFGPFLGTVYNLSGAPARRDAGVSNCPLSCL